jgi:hypothetical protein
MNRKAERLNSYHESDFPLMDEKDGSIMGAGPGTCRGRPLLGAFMPVTESDPGAVRHPDSGESPCACVGDSTTAGARRSHKWIHNAEAVVIRTGGHILRIERSDTGLLASGQQHTVPVREAETPVQAECYLERLDARDFHGK